MLRMPEGKRAADYLARRGVLPETIARFRLGYAPEGRFALKAALTRAGVGEDLMVESGLVVVPADGGGGAYDRFRGRVMFPITDRRGRIVGFGGRVLGAGEPKYLNSPETALFQKGRLLYGLSQALPAIRDAGVIVVEGYLDVIGLVQAGYGHTVAPLGTALTADQLEALWQLAAEPVLWFDPDAAGRRAAVRAADLALPLIRPGVGLRFAFSRLDTGDDPADLARRYAPQFVHRTLADAIALSDLVFRVARGEGRLDTAEDRARIEARLEAHVARIADPRMQRHYRSLFRERLFQALRPAADRGRAGAAVSLPRLSVRGVAAPPATPAASPSSLRANAERGLLALVLAHPWLFDEIEDRFGSMQCADRNFDGLRQALVAVLSGRADPPAPGVLRAELEAAGFAGVIGEILGDPAHRLASRRMAGQEPAQIRARCEESIAVITQTRLREELIRVPRDDETTENWADRRALIESSLGRDDR
jgi:DNA primase